MPTPPGLLDTIRQDAPHGAWPAEMRADMAAAFLDYATTGELTEAITRGAPWPTDTRPVKGCRA